MLDKEVNYFCVSTCSLQCFMKSVIFIFSDIEIVSQSYIVHLESVKIVIILNTFKFRVISLFHISSVFCVKIVKLCLILK